jgi:hypothetical protein
VRPALLASRRPFGKRFFRSSPTWTSPFSQGRSTTTIRTSATGRPPPDWVEDLGSPIDGYWEVRHTECYGGTLYCFCTDQYGNNDCTPCGSCENWS